MYVCGREIGFRIFVIGKSARLHCSLPHKLDKPRHWKAAMIDRKVPHTLR
jgi:hypothetical protein